MSAKSALAWQIPALAGCCATLVALGIGRFGFVPLLPLLIDAGWSDAHGAAQWAAANLLGYLAGALSAHRLGLRFGSARLLHLGMLVALAVTAVAAVHPPFLVLWWARLLAGLSGGWLMIVAPAHALSQVEPQHRGRAAGTVFAGVGLGAVLTGMGVPAFGVGHIEQAWLAMAGLIVLAILIAWRNQARPMALAPLAEGEGASKTVALRGPLLALGVAYGLDAMGYVPHTIFWVEYLVHGLGKPAGQGGWSWALFGFGAMLGPLIAGWLADRFGFVRLLPICFGIKAVAIGLPLLSQSELALMVSPLVVGALTPGISMLVSGRLLELAGVQGHRKAWAAMTLVFSVLQAAGGYLMAGLYSAMHSFNLLFAVGAGLLLLGCAASLKRD